MLERLRFQEITSVIFKVPRDMVINNRRFKKGQSFLIIDEPSLSSFNVNEITKQAYGRTYEGSTNLIGSVTFDIVDGYMLLNMWNSIYSNLEKKKKVVMTKKEIVYVDDVSEVELSEKPLNDNIFIYTVNENNKVIDEIRPDQYSIEDKIVKFVDKFTHNIGIVYETEVESREVETVSQIGANIVLDLEVQCMAQDPISGEKLNVLLKFGETNVSPTNSIRFNSDNAISFTNLHCTVLPKDSKIGVNKKLYELVVL